MRKHCLLTIALLLSIKMLPQRKAVFDPVVLWGISHPFAASKIKKINNQCQFIYRQKEIKERLDSFSSGGKLDAFRHVFFMAAFQKEVSTNKLRKLGRAHENKNYRQFLKGEADNEGRHDSLSMIMDLHNNEVAFNLKEATKEMGLDDLKELVIQTILSGKALILKRNSSGKLLMCDNTVLTPDNLAKAWYVPKCLVKSDYIYMD